MPALRFKLDVDPAHPPLLVGEDNPYGGFPQNALLPRPANSAGWRLCHRVMRMDERIYLKVFLRYNLCTGKWDHGEAENRAHGLKVLYQCNHKILLGAKVARAFGVEFRPFRVETALMAPEMVPVKTLVLPHPSGRCREWNKPGSYEKALRGLKEILCG